MARLEDQSEPNTSVGTGSKTDDQLGSDSGTEKINHPSHYNIGSIEVIDYIEAWGMDFNQGNLIKYATRFKHKKSPLEDLLKAKWYLDRLLEIERSK